MKVAENFKAACLPLSLQMISTGRRNSDAKQLCQGRRIYRLLIALIIGLQDEIKGTFLFFQTASMLALVLSCSFLFPSLEICRNASTP